MRLGCLPYLNVKPLVYTLERDGLPKGWELVYAPPSQLAKMLVSGEIAAAPVSSFATFEYPELDVCPGICIAADGPVNSVLMLHTKPLKEIKSVSLDSSSLSGAGMLKVILKELYGVEPAFNIMPPQTIIEILDGSDAALLIGNAAMTCQKDGLQIFDLAEEWKKLTGLPAVFAVWAGREINQELVQILREAKSVGLTKFDKIARAESAHLGLQYEICYDYLSKIMIYELGEREHAGLEVFKAKVISHGLIKQI